MAAADPKTAVTLEIRDYVGIITLNVEKKLNALSQALYRRIVELLDELAAHPSTYITVITGKGRFFSAGADVTSINTNATAGNEYWLDAFMTSGLANTNKWYMHPKILVAALNGPVVGVTAALIAHCDFIFAAPHTYLMTPFSSLGLVAEGGSSRAFVSRMGVGLANEALLMGRRIPVEDLLRARFVNKVIDAGGGDRTSGRGIDTERFLAAVLQEIDDRLGKHLVRDSLLKIKALIRREETPRLDTASVAEALEGVNVFAKGVPQEEFRKIVSGEKRHKL